jgi:hypothetical protein
MYFSRDIITAGLRYEENGKSGNEFSDTQRISQPSKSSR